MKNILLINFGGLGDEILFLPAIATLKKEFKNAKITLCLEPRSQAIIYLTNLIDDIITVDIKKSGIAKYIELLSFIFKAKFGGFDLIISTGSSDKVAKLLNLTGIKYKIGYKSDAAQKLTCAVNLNINQYAARMYHDLVTPLSDEVFENPKIEIRNPNTIDYLLTENFLKEGYVAIHPGVSKMSVKKNILKCPNVDFWIELVKKLIEKGKNVVLLGGGEDYDIINDITKKIGENKRFLNLFGKTKKIIDVVKIINKSNAFICVDSAPMHMAVAINKRTIAIFGPTDEKKLLPNDEKFIAIKNDVDCRPCLFDKRKACCDEPKCLKIDVNKILEKI